MNKQPIEFVICLDNEGYPASLEIGKLYRFIPDEDAAVAGLMRVIDESGEDYAFQGKRFRSAKGAEYESQGQAQSEAERQRRGI